ncbi:MAG: hypothetical protein U5K29_11205 [Acidimicrobiales bacterium]|nr:hypothetical protein [Acidimicrobiales bacterium]
MALVVCLAVGLGACAAVGPGEGSDPGRSLGVREASAPGVGPRDEVVAAADRAQRVSSGRFGLQVSLGREGAMVASTTVEGVFDHDAGASETVVDLASLRAQLPAEAGPIASEGLGDELIVRIVDGTVYLYVGTADREWVLYPVDAAQASRTLGLARPDRFLQVLESVGDEVTVTEAPPLDGEPTRRYSGWIDPEGFSELSADGAGGALDQMADSLPPGLLDRIVRFDAWIGDDGVARRVVIELDREAVFDLAERVEGPQALDAALPVMRYEVDWFDLDTPVRIEPPPPDQVSVIDLDAIRPPG